MLTPPISDGSLPEAVVTPSALILLRNELWLTKPTLEELSATELNFKY